MLVAEVIQRILSPYSGGVQSDDSRLTPRHAYSALLTARSTLLRQRANKGQHISQWSYQSLSCIELTKAAVHECPCAPTQGCMILRSKHKLPEPVVGIESSLIQYVTSFDGSIRFDEETFETSKYSIGNKYTSNKPGFLIHNGYLFITTLKLLKAVSASGLFNDIIEAYEFPSICGVCEGCECIDPMSYEFCIDGDLITPLLQIASNELIVMMKQLGQDRTNNADDDTESSGSMIHTPQQQDQG